METTRTKKLMWLSNAPWVPSGYGQQTALFVPMIREEGYDTALIANHGLDGAVMPWNGMPVYPTDHTRLAKYRLPEYANHFTGGALDDLLVITLMDVWTLIDMRWGGHAFWHDIPKVAAWVPIDHAPAPPNVLEGLLELGLRPIAMSKFGRDSLIGEGFADTLYVPHGVDTAVFKPGDRQLYREKVGLPDDAFIVGMVANNQGSGPSRKSFPEVFQAFAVFLERHPNAYLYLHTDVYGFNDGVNLLALAQIIGIPPDRLLQTDQTQYFFGIPPSQLALLYSMFDVLASPSYGEGFGIPIIEAQACGCPVIVSDWTAMTELCGAGWLVDGDSFYDPAHGSFYLRPAISEIVQAFEDAYDARGEQVIRDAAVEFAQAYDARTVFEQHWKPVLAELDAWVPEPRVKLTQADQPAAPAGNREQRRAAAKKAPAKKPAAKRAA